MEKNLREIQEEREKNYLGSFACLSRGAKRECPEELCPVRTEFQRDRDRILYSKAFRRLMHKTQVFIAPEGDHYRTRLTHTLEVSQIARTIARALRLNEDLTEAISLGHDLGHAPFGHAGEATLDRLMRKYNCRGFHHAEQSLRVVDLLEKQKGLNLTLPVRNGIISHTKGRGNIDCHGVIEEPKTLEAAVVKISDRLAYINHDIDDAQRAGIITQADIPDDLVKLFGAGISQRVNNMVMNIVENSWEKPEILMSPEFARGLNRLKEFMFEKVYTNSPAKAEEHKADKLVEHLFEYFLENTSKIPEYMLEIGAGERCIQQRIHLAWEDEDSSCCPLSPESDDIEFRAQAVCDFIAGMTDRYAIALYKKLFIPRGWNQ